MTLAQTVYNGRAFIERYRRFLIFSDHKIPTKRTMNKLFLYSLLILTFISCSWNNEEDLFDGILCEIEEISFNNDIKPIIVNHCLVCHSAAANLGNVVLQEHNNVRIYGENGRLLGSIKHSAGFSPMPQSGSKLNDCNIQKIEGWINNGMPNN